MPRLEDKIRSLCTKVLDASDDEELGPLLDELRGALHQHIERLRGRLRVYPFVLERRARHQVPPPDLPLRKMPRTDQPPQTRRK
jgi:hypothetical protein